MGFNFVKGMFDMKNSKGLPMDLRKYARAAFWRKSRAFIISFVLTVLALVFFGELILPTKYPEAKAIIYTVILALPFVFTKFPFCVIDSTYCGIVEDIEVKMTKDARPAAYSYKGYTLYDKGAVYLKIRTPDGRLIRRKVYGGIASLQKYINKLNEFLTLATGDEAIFIPYIEDTISVYQDFLKLPVLEKINAIEALKNVAKVPSKTTFKMQSQKDFQDKERKMLFIF